MHIFPVYCDWLTGTINSGDLIVASAPRIKCFIRFWRRHLHIIFNSIDLFVTLFGIEIHHFHIKRISDSFCAKHNEYQQKISIEYAHTKRLSNCLSIFPYNMQNRAETRVIPLPHWCRCYSQ